MSGAQRPYFLSTASSSYLMRNRLHLLADSNRQTAYCGYEATAAIYRLIRTPRRHEQGLCFRMMNVSIIGGGRWARTIASVLCALPRRSDRITLHSPSNSADLKAWVEQPQFAHRLRAVGLWPSFPTSEDRPDAVIVANRVGQHFLAASTALKEGVPVLVEKPVSLSIREIMELGEIASAKGTVFAASHVFLFARYLEAYAAALSEPRSLRFVWTDGIADIVRDEAKSYDAAVPVFDDVLPHILPMIGRLQFRDCALGSIDVQCGGARLEIGLLSGEWPVSLLVARNDDSRRRLIEIVTDNGTVTLDFAKEPGTIGASLERRNGDPLWDTAPRPLATMLIAFLAAAEGGPLDPRLSPALAVTTAALADMIRGPYREHQAQWLEKRLGEPLDPPLQYALTELSGDGQGGRDMISATWSSIRDKAELGAFLSRSPLWPTASSGQITDNL
jgi:predicted dehydrogenase